MKYNNKYILHIINQLADDISPDDEKQLKAWLDADPNHQEEYDLIAKIIREGQQIEFPAEPEVQNEWNAFMFPEGLIPKQNTSSQRISALGDRITLLLQPRRLAYLAIIIFMIGAFAFWYHYYIHSIEIITTANRQHKEIKLSDGTIVYMNSGTELTYPKTFSGAIREVNLTGEAFFDVAKSKFQYVVQTSEGTVAVLGTRFNVWARNMRTRVFVEEGRVLLAVNDTSDSVILTKDLMSEICQNQPPLKPRSINAEELLAWRSGKLVFKRTILSELVGEISRYYDIDVSIDDPELKTKTITATFDRLPLDKVLYSICSSLNIQYRYENGLYIFSKESGRDN